MIISERISILVSFTLFGLVAFFLVELPGRAVEWSVFGSTLTLVLSQRWLMGLLLGGLVATGTIAVVHTHPLLGSRNTGYCLTLWLLPTLLIVLATLILPLLAFNLGWWVLGVGVTGLLLWFAVLGIYHTIDSRDRWYEISHLWINLLGYTVAFGYFIIIFQARPSGLLSALVVLLVSALLAASLLKSGPAQTSRTWLFASIISLATAQSAWALHFWRVPPLVAAFCLLLIFYLLTGLAQQQILGRLTRRALIEFGGVTLVGLFVIFQFAL